MLDRFFWTVEANGGIHGDFSDYGQARETAEFVKGRIICHEFKYVRSFEVESYEHPAPEAPRQGCPCHARGSICAACQSSPCVECNRIVRRLTRQGGLEENDAATI